MKQKLLAIFSILILFSACGKTNKQELKVVNLQGNEELIDLAKNLESNMLDFMVESETTSYTTANVENCAKIINNFLVDLSPITDKEEALKIVEHSISNLNNLNAACNGALIETGERETIAEIFILSSYLKGLNERDEDITEAWREW